jgi:Holliday junction resolvase RusA-like endonuclease
VRATGHAFTPAATRKYESHLRLAAQEAMAGRAPLDGPVKVRVVAAFPVPASWSRRKRADALAGIIRPTVKPDADNLIKCVGDGLNAVIWRDDSQIVTASIAKIYSDRPALRIEIEPIVTALRETARAPEPELFTRAAA